MTIFFNKKFYAILSSAIFFFCVSISANSADKPVTITAKTTSYGGEWAPHNFVFIWIQKPDSTYIKTIYAKLTELKYAAYFKTWLKAKGILGKELLADIDGMTGATGRPDHESQITATWDLKDRNGNPVPQGTYQFCIEMTEDDFEGSATCGTITIDGTDKIVQGTTTDRFPEFKACIGDNCVSKVIPTLKTRNAHSISIKQTGNHFKINLPSSGSYSASFISPSGKVIASNNGTGKTAILNVNSNQLKSGVYLIKVVQSGKVYTQKNIFGF